MPPLALLLSRDLGVTKNFADLPKAHPLPSHFLYGQNYSSFRLVLNDLYNFRAIGKGLSWPRG